MLFNSYIFIFLFFPICLLGYYGLLHLQKKEAAQFFLLAMRSEERHVGKECM